MVRGEEEGGEAAERTQLLSLFQLTVDVTKHPLERMLSSEAEGMVEFVESLVVLVGQVLAGGR
ncbi:hypothetical protein NXT08_24860 (plasmid) [Rhodococcus pyridinivorans]|uniref:hypothetical protein n=1 Tax=Rhodococcus pyridinivorans TaxID=103816 RepID=UPI002164C28A|nr:hypothetical protein [Rhodococcus pyridinivorans]UVT27729.1 hypothetical protein NXT08_24860 [Rhodococcus pyridinivorans]